MATKAERRQATQNRIKAMCHPLRAEAFRLIRERSTLMSPADVARELEADVREVSYHIRKLNDFDCIEKVESRQVRNTLQHFYRATEQHMIDTEEWGELADLEPAMAEALTDEFMQGIVDDYSASRRAGIVGLDEEFYIVRTPLMLDPEGVRKVMEAAQRFEDEAIEAAAESAQRHTKECAPEVPVSSSIVFFKMPKSPTRRPDFSV